MSHYYASGICVESRDNYLSHIADKADADKGISYGIEKNYTDTIQSNSSMERTIVYQDFFSNLIGKRAM